MHAPCVAIPRDVVLALRDVERRRLTDMYDREMVILLADVFRHEGAAEWLTTNRHLYFDALEWARASGEIEAASEALADMMR
jgi:hypothetical protein